MTARASLILPAHDEARVIGRLLDRLSAGGLSPDIEVIVVANGCSDDTVGVATRHGAPLDARVVHVTRPSKAGALNEGDRLASAFPRVYLDADVEVDPESLEAVFRALGRGPALAARPTLRYLTEGGDPFVRAFYRARQRTPELVGQLWGAGCYAVSELGRSRWGEFPEGAADDLFVAEQFDPHEVAIVESGPVLVRTPRTSRALLRTLRRVYGLGGTTDPPRTRSRSSSALRALLRANAAPTCWWDAAVYVAFAVGARLPSRRSGATRWARDETTR